MSWIEPNQHLLPPHPARARGPDHGPAALITDPRLLRGEYDILHFTTKQFRPFPQPLAGDFPAVAAFLPSESPLRATKASRPRFALARAHTRYTVAACLAAHALYTVAAMLVRTRFTR